MRIGILNGGGDCAGLNAVIAAIFKTGTRDNHEFIGIEHGFEGLLGEPRYKVLTYDLIKNITNIGGTILYTTNKGHFSAKTGDGENIPIPQAILDDAKNNLQKLGIEYLITIGGDGTQSGALQLQSVGVKIVAVPKTIDNDLSVTDRTFGFSSAVEYVSESLDRLITSATSHERLLIVETMGRNTGWLAMYGGIAGSADVILIPEFQFTYKNLLLELRRRKRISHGPRLIVVAEGATAVGEEKILQHKEFNKENLLGGISVELMNMINLLAPDEFEIRNVILGHLQRGGSPNAEDRILAQRFGVAAMELIAEDQAGYMVCLQGDSITKTLISDAVNQLKLITLDTEIVSTAKKLGIYLGE